MQFQQTGGLIPKKVRLSALPAWFVTTSPGNLVPGNRTRTLISWFWMWLFSWSRSRLWTDCRLQLEEIRFKNTNLRGKSCAMVTVWCIEYDVHQTLLTWCEFVRDSWAGWSWPETHCWSLRLPLSPLRQFVQLRSTFIPCLHVPVAHDLTSLQVFGDLHGQYFDFMNILSFLAQKLLKNTGGYVMQSDTLTRHGWHALSQHVWWPSYIRPWIYLHCVGILCCYAIFMMILWNQSQHESAEHVIRFEYFPIIR